MKAVVLVGGFGTRLRPLTNTTPKPMLPVANKPIIEHIVASLARAGVDEVVLALGFKPEPFIEGFPDGTCAGVKLTYAVEPEPLDTAGAIRFAALAGGITDTFVVANGDIMTDLDVSELIRAHRRYGAEATIHVYPVTDPSAFGVVEITADDRVVRFVEKPAPGEEPSNLINAGTYVLEPSVIDRIADGRKVSIERETFPAISADAGLYAYVADVYWLDTGRPQQYLQANLDALDGKRAHIAVDDGGGHSVVDPSAIVDGMVVDCVVLPGAYVGTGAFVARSIVAGHVSDDAIVEDCVVGVDGIVEAGSTVRGGTVPPVG